MMGNEQLNLAKQTIELAFKGIGVVMIGLLGYFATKTLNNIDKSFEKIEQELNKNHIEMQKQVLEMNLNIRGLEKKVDRMEIYYEIKEGKR